MREATAIVATALCKRSMLSKPMLTQFQLRRIQLVMKWLSDNGKGQDQNGQSGSSGIGVRGTSTSRGGM